VHSLQYLYNSGNQLILPTYAPSVLISHNHIYSRQCATSRKKAENDARDANLRDPLRHYSRKGDSGALWKGQGILR